jgi:SAM-dependent methyltransferase
VLDFGAGTSEEIAELWPDADEYVFLDSFTWPPERPRYRLLRQSAGSPLPFPDGHLDLVTSNGSFDHFTDADRRTAFHEIERCLRPGGMFLFACEYFDFDPADEQAFFERCATHPEAVAMNCPAFSNIDLRAICDGLTTLRPLQDDLSALPDGRPLRALASPDHARYFRSHSPTLEAYWGSFFVAFAKQA